MSKQGCMVRAPDSSGHGMDGEPKVSHGRRLGSCSFKGLFLASDVVNVCCQDAGL